MMHNHKKIFISGWGTTLACDDSIIAFPFRRFHRRVKHIPWWECLESQNNSLHSFLSGADKPIQLIGWSLGGMIALSAAIDFPEKVASLVLISSSARMVSDEGYEGTNKRVLKAMRIRLRTDKAGVLKDFATMANYPDNDDKICDKYLKSAMKIDTDKLSKGLTYLEKFDLRDQLSNIKVPVKIIHGECDNIINPKNAQYLKENIPNTDLKLIPDMGHFLIHYNSQPC